VFFRTAILVTLVALAAGCATLDGSRLFKSGTAALDAGDPVAAVRDLEAAARAIPDASEIQNHLGLAYEAAGRPDAALAAFRQAVALDCDNQPAQRNLALAEERAKRTLSASP